MSTFILNFLCIPYFLVKFSPFILGPLLSEKCQHTLVYISHEALGCSGRIEIRLIKLKLLKLIVNSSLFHYSTLRVSLFSKGIRVLILYIEEKRLKQ